MRASNQSLAFPQFGKAGKIKGPARNIQQLSTQEQKKHIHDIKRMTRQARYGLDLAYLASEASPFRVARSNFIIELFDFQSQKKTTKTRLGNCAQLAKAYSKLLEKPYGNLYDIKLASGHCQTYFSALGGINHVFILMRAKNKHMKDLMVDPSFKNQVGFLEDFLADNKYQITLEAPAKEASIDDDILVFEDPGTNILSAPIGYAKDLLPSLTRQKRISNNAMLYMNIYQDEKTEHLEAGLLLQKEPDEIGASPLVTTGNHPLHLSLPANNPLRLFLEKIQSGLDSLAHASKK